MASRVGEGQEPQQREEKSELGKAHFFWRKVCLWQNPESTGVAGRKGQERRIRGAVMEEGDTEDNEAGM